MYKYFYESIYVLVGVVILLVGFFVISPGPLAFFSPIVNVIGGLIAVVPPILIFYTKFRIKREIEEQFLVFVSDLTESVNSGMTLPMSLKHCARRDYLALTPHVKALAAHVDWGVPFQKALKIFSKKLGSVPIERAATTITATYRVGGKISDTLEAVSKSLITISKIKRERRASVHSQLITSYMIFFIFIFILVVLQTFLIPALAAPKMPTGIATGVETVPSKIYTGSFINFIIIQGFFAGLVTGKMAEGSMTAGLKHSVMLIALGYTIFSFASQFQIALF